jgi:hypothetical protein
MDAYDISDKIKKYWCAVVPKNSGEITKTNKKVRVVVNTDEGYREVVGVYIKDDMIELTLDKE